MPPDILFIILVVYCFSPTATMEAPDQKGFLSILYSLLYAFNSVQYVLNT
jgi:hypothetical protein